MTQDQWMSFLVEAFKADSGEYQDLITPKDTSDRQRILRSLMNVRMPDTMPKNVLRIQDDYLQSRAKEKGIVKKMKTNELKLNEMKHVAGGNFFADLEEVLRRIFHDHPEPAKPSDPASPKPVTARGKC